MCRLARIMTEKSGVSVVGVVVVAIRLRHRVRKRSALTKDAGAMERMATQKGLTHVMLYARRG